MKNCGIIIKVAFVTNKIFGVWMSVRPLMAGGEGQTVKKNATSFFRFTASEKSAKVWGIA